MISLLMVTRERADDRRFGLGKSLCPVIAGLQRHGVMVVYLSQEDSGPRSQAWMQRLQRWIVRLSARWLPVVDVDPLVGAILERLNMGRLAAKVAFERDITHVHCHDPLITVGFQWFRWWYGGRQARRVRHGLTQHGFGSYTQALHEDGARLDHRVMGWMRGWERRIIQRSDWVVSPTRASRDQLARDLAYYPLPPHWHVIPHPRPVLEVPSRSEARRLLGWEDHWFVVLGVGRNAPLKRFQDLIQACARIDHSRVHLVLLGVDEDPELRQIALQAGLPSDRLHMQVTHQVEWYYGASDVYVSTSDTESFGLANLEAQVAGLPVLATAVGGVAEVVGNGGWLLPPRHPVALAEAIETLLQEPDQRLALSTRAMRWAGRWPDAEKIARQYLALYQGDEVEDAVHLDLKLFRAEQDGWETELSLYPTPRPLELPRGIRFLVFAPHPDDETLGVGGMLAGLNAREAKVRVVVVTAGERGDPEQRFPEPAATVRQRELRRALAVLGVGDCTQWDYPDGGCRDDEGLRERIEQEICDFKPDWLLVPAPLEIHRDHVAVARAVTFTWMRLGVPCRLFYYEVSQPLPASHVVDVTPWEEIKLKALGCYRLPLSYCDYSRMSESLMQYRAECLLPGARSVEALMEVPASDVSGLLHAMSMLRSRLETTDQTNGSGNHAI